jgi:exodeoxyribonuclease VII large subunit
VISAVGHEVDVTISDLVADLRAPTPSAAAEAVAPDVEEILRYLEGAGKRLAGGLRRTVTGPRRTLSEIRGRLGRRGRDLVPPRRRTLSDAREALTWAMEGKLQSRRFSLVRLGEKVDALSPLSTLRRGYAVPLAPDGRVLRSVGDFSEGEGFQLRVLDGRVHAETKEIDNDEVDHGG